MGVLGDSWCFCKGVGKSKRMKAAIFSNKASAMVRVGELKKTESFLVLFYKNSFQFQEGVA